MRLLLAALLLAAPLAAQDADFGRTSGAVTDSIGPPAPTTSGDDRALLDEPPPSDRQLEEWQDDRLQSDSESPAEPPARKFRYRVGPRMAPLNINGRKAGVLFRWSVVETTSQTSAGGQIPIDRLVSGFVDPTALGSATPAGSTTDRVETAAAVDWLYLRTSLGRIRGGAKLEPSAPFWQSIPELQASRGWFRGHATPIGASVAAEALVPIGPTEEEPADRRLESGDIEIRFLSISGTVAAPVVTEIRADDPAIGNFNLIDFEAGLARQIRYYGAMWARRPLYVFLVDDPNKRVAHEHTLLPVPGRVSPAFIKVEATMADGSTETIEEPFPTITFPKHQAEREHELYLTSTLKHELGHVLQDSRAPIMTKGYGVSFGAHDLPVRTRDDAAFTEGFAEYAAYKFRDGNHENSPERLRDITLRNNRRAYGSLQYYYWLMARRKLSSASQLTAAALDEAEVAVLKDSEQLSFEAFKSRIGREMIGRGEPPLTLQTIDGQLTALDDENLSAVANLRDEELTPQEQEEIKEALNDLIASTFSLEGGPTFKKKLERARNLAYRDGTDLLLNEGAVTTVLLELDEHFSKTKNIDFFGKVLLAMNRDPYGGKSDPPYPVNLKEMLAVLDRSPELQGEIFPVVERATDGRLTAADFVLAPSREQDSLPRTRPGLPRPDAVPVSASPTATTTGDLMPEFEETARARPIDIDPDFADLRSR